MNWTVSLSFNSPLWKLFDSSVKIRVKLEVKDWKKEVKTGSDGKQVLY